MRFLNQDVLNLKKIISILLVIALIACFVPAVSAAGSASLSGPSVVRAGDTITLSFSAGGGIYGGSGSVSYDSSQLTLQGYSQSVGGSWAVEFNGNSFVFYDNSMASPIGSSTTIFTATFAVKSGVATGASVSVTASGVTLSDGQQDIGAGSPSWSTTIAAPLSGNCNLASLSVSNAALSPAFSAGTTSYTVSVPYSVSSLNISAGAAHPGAKVSIDNPTLSPASNTTVRITVTAENGAEKTYTIKAWRAQDPNYVESSNANLESLSVDGYQLSPAFAVDVLQYYIWLPYEAETVTINAEEEDGRASVSIGECPELIPGKGVDIPVTVTAEDDTQQIYTITVIRAPAHEDIEKYLTCDHEEEPEPTEPITEPTEPVTEPVTEPITEPITEAVTEPVTEPVVQPVPEEEGLTFSLLVLIITGVLCAGAGVGISFGVPYLMKHLNKKNAPAPEETVADEEDLPTADETEE